MTIPPIQSTTPAPAEDGSPWQQIFGVGDMQSQIDSAIAWAEATIFNVNVAIQLGLVVAALAAALIFGPQLKRFFKKRIIARLDPGVLQKAAKALAVIAVPIALYVWMMIFRIILGSAGYPVAVIEGALSLLTAWIAIRLVTLLIRSKFWSAAAFYIAWPVAALDAFGLLDDVVAQMQALAIPLGEGTGGQPIAVSLLDIVRTLLYFGVLFWGASLLGRTIETQIERIDELTPSFKALIVKILKIALPVVALIIALQIVGFNLATLAVFSGALGLGIGLGLQRIVANFIAGFTLIADRSIKPSDVIEIDSIFGWVTAMEARYVAIRTRDGTEHLIPNDRFMSEGVVNWSRSDRVVRLHAPFGVSYETDDLRAVQQLAVKAAARVERVVETPKPVCNVMEFGDSSVNFDLRFWIRDPVNGMANVRSEVYLEVWDGLKAAGIAIPFPQRDLHVKSWPETAAEHSGADRNAPPTSSQAAKI